MSSGIKMSVFLFSFAFVSVLSVDIDNEKTGVYIKPNNVSNEKPVEYKIEEFNITEPLYVIVPKDRNESFIGPPEHHDVNRKLLEDSYDDSEEEDYFDEDEDDDDSDEDVESGNRRLLIKLNPKKIVSNIKKIIPDVKGIKIYGNFCGPNYCGGQKFKGAEGPKCLWGVSPKDSLDQCCKIHDKCCGFPETRGTNCNKEILSCVKSVKCNDKKCDISKTIIKTTFSAIKNKVCGNVFGSKKENNSSGPTVKTVSKVGVSIQKPSVSKLNNTQTSSPTVKPVIKLKGNVEKPSTSQLKNTQSSTPTVKPIPKSVEENHQFHFSSNPESKSNLISHEKANSEIHDSVSKTNKNLELFKERIISFMNEIEHSEKEVEIKNQNDYNDVEESLNHEESRLEESRQILKNLYNETESLNITIQTHYKRMISDTEYLKTLDSMRPSFLKSLDEISAHIEAVKNVVDQKLIKDEYKDEMLSLLTGIHFDTHNISGYVATAFINHYNKFKNSIQIEDTTYLNEMKKLTILSNKYKEQQKQIIELENERARLENILEKLKKTLLLTETQKKEFNMMFNEIISLFNGIRNSCN